MVDNTIALQSKIPEGSDLSTTLLRAFQMKQMQQQGDLTGLRMQQLHQSMQHSAAEQGRVAEQQGALKEFAKNPEAPGAIEKLTPYPATQSAVFANMDNLAKARMSRISDAVSVVAPLYGREGFKETFDKEIDGLVARGDMPKERGAQMKSQPPELALQQAMAMSRGFDAWNKLESQKNAKNLADGIKSALGGVGPTGQAPRVDPYQAKLTLKENSGRMDSSPTSIKDQNGEPISTATGPAQFLTGTWADMIAKHPDLGFTMADIRSPEKQLIMEERFRRDNAKELLKNEIVPTDRNLYMTHWLGSSGGPRFLKALEQNPNQPAINFVSEAAVRNHSNIFYSPGGQPLTLQQVYDKQSGLFGDGNDGVTGLLARGTRQASSPDDPNGTTLDRLVKITPYLMAGALSPDVPAEDRKHYMELTKLGLESSKPTELRKNYLDYVKDTRATGGPDAKVDPIEVWDRKNRREGAGKVEIGTDKPIDKQVGEDYVTALRSYPQAAAEAARYSQLGEILNNPSVYTGTGGKLIADAKKLGSSLLGLNFEGVPDAEVGNNIAKKIALDYRAKGKDTNTSNYEQRVYEAMAPGIETTAPGRALLIEMKKEEAEHARAVGNVWRAHRDDNGKIDHGVYDALGKLETDRQSRWADFLERARSAAKEVPQQPPTAGTKPGFDDLRKMYPGLQ